MLNIPDNIIVKEDSTIYNTKTNKYLHGSCNSCGYIQITINDKKYLRSHIVASKFLDNPNNYKEVNHIDGDVTNDNVNNLEWCTHSENAKKRIKGGKLRKIKTLISFLSESDKIELKKYINNL